MGICRGAVSASKRAYVCCSCGNKWGTCESKSSWGNSL